VGFLLDKKNSKLVKEGRLTYSGNQQEEKEKNAQVA
jgi:hypothetical protein